MKKALILTGLVLTVVLMLAVTGCNAIDAKSLDGILKNVDRLSGNVTVTLKDGQTLNFNLADINLNDILAATDNVGLENGDHVRLQLGPNGKVNCVSFNATQLKGTIKAIAANNATITITASDNTDITLNITADTKVVAWAMGRTEVKDLKAGESVFVLYDKDTMTAENIHVMKNGPAWQDREMKQPKQPVPDHGFNGKTGPHGKGNGSMHNTARSGNQAETQTNSPGVALNGQEE